MEDNYFKDLTLNILTNEYHDAWIEAYAAPQKGLQLKHSQLQLMGLLKMIESSPPNIHIRSPETGEILKSYSTTHELIDDGWVIET